jgi:hypothetical protein
LFTQNGATGVYTGVLTAGLIAALYPNISNLIAKTSLLMLRRYRVVELSEISTAAIRLLATTALLTLLPNAFGALAALALANVWQFGFLRMQQRRYVDPKAMPNAEYTVRASAIVRKWFPTIVFFVLQGQLGFIVISVVATSTEVADVAAVSRVAGIVAVFGAAFYHVAAPRFATVGGASLLRRDYAITIGLAVLGSTAIWLTVYIAPAPFLWLLGPQYAGLEGPVATAVGAAGIANIAGSMFALNQSRGWSVVYRRFYVPATATGMLAGATVLDLSSVQGVLFFGCVGPAITATLCAADAVVGLRS